MFIEREGEKCDIKEDAMASIKRSLISNSVRIGKDDVMDLKGKNVLIKKGESVMISAESTATNLETKQNQINQCPAQVFRSIFISFNQKGLVKQIVKAFKESMKGFDISAVREMRDQTVTQEYFRDILCLKQERFAIKVKRKRGR